MPLNVAEELLQGLKKVAFDQDLFKELEEDPSLYSEIMAAMRKVQDIRAETALSKYLGEFEFMLNADSKSIKLKEQASKSIQDIRAKNNEQVDIAQKFNDETQAIKLQLKEAASQSQVLDKEIDELSKLLAAKQKEKATLDNTKAKMQEEMAQKAQEGIKIAKGVLDSRKSSKVLENEHATACQRVDAAYKSYQDLKTRCPF